jgi:hypothetical protein
MYSIFTQLKFLRSIDDDVINKQSNRPLKPQLGTMRIKCIYQGQTASTFHHPSGSYNTIMTLGQFFDDRTLTQHRLAEKMVFHSAPGPASLLLFVTYPKLAPHTCAPCTSGAGLRLAAHIWQRGSVHYKNHRYDGKCTPGCQIPDMPLSYRCNHCSVHQACRMLPDAMGVLVDTSYMTGPSSRAPILERLASSVQPHSHTATQLHSYTATQPQI